MSHPEHAPHRESRAEVQTAAGERAEQLNTRIEKTAEQSPDTHQERIDSARREAKEVFTKEPGKERSSNEPASAAAIRTVAKADKLMAYKKTMHTIQREMGSSSRAFSKFIHSPFVERSSDIIGSSLARPNAVLAGSAMALILVSGVYVTARSFGYQLSGFETIGAFVIGWLIGIVFDYFRAMISGKH